MAQRTLAAKPTARTALAVQVFWGRQRVAAYTLRGGSADCVRVGSGAGVDVVVPAGVVGERLVVAHARRGPRVVLPRGIGGTLERRSGASIALDELRRSGALDEVEGEQELALCAGERVVLRLGALQLEAVAAREPTQVRGSSPWDFRWLNTLVATAALAAFLVVSWINAAASGGLEGEPALAPPPTHLRAWVVPPPAPERTAAPQRDVSARRTPTPSHARRPAARPGPAAKDGASGALRRVLAGGLFEGGVALPASGAALAQLTSGITAVQGTGLGGLGLKGDASGGGREESIGLGGLSRPSGGHPPGEPSLRKDPGPQLPEPTIGAVEVSGYDRELIRSTVRDHRGELRYCYEVRLSRQPTLEGRVSVRFTLGADGRVAAASVASSTANDLELEACLVGRVRAWRFPAPKGGARAVVTYPFVFSRPPK